jgi:hypothetical protein
MGLGGNERVKGKAWDIMESSSKTFTSSADDKGDPGVLSSTDTGETTNGPAKLEFSSR